MSEYKDSYLACNMSALNPVEREIHRTLLLQLSRQFQELRELPDGFAFLFPGTALETIAQFVPLERKCCPFLDFILEVERHDGPVRLTIKGPEGVKKFLIMDLNLGPAFLPNSSPKAGSN
jgi:hypothetical protein